MELLVADRKEVFQWVPIPLRLILAPLLEADLSIMWGFSVSNLAVPPPTGSNPYTVNFDLNVAHGPGIPPGLGIQSNFTESVAAGSANFATWFVPLNTPQPNTSLNQLSTQISTGRIPAMARNRK